MLEFLFEILAELLLQLVGEVLVEFGLHTLAAPFRRDSPPALAAFAYGVFGCIAGGLTLLVFPNHLVVSVPLRWANLVVTPLACGGVMSAMGAWRRRRGDELFRIDRFAYGFLFAVSLALVRFLFAH